MHCYEVTTRESYLLPTMATRTFLMSRDVPLSVLPQPGDEYPRMPSLVVPDDHEPEIRGEGEQRLVTIRYVRRTKIKT